MDRKPVWWHPCHILKKYNLLSFERFIHLSFLNLVFKCINSVGPECFSRHVQRKDSDGITGRQGVTVKYHITNLKLDSSKAKQHVYMLEHT